MWMRESKTEDRQRLKERELILHDDFNDDITSGQIEIKESKRQRGQEWFCVLLSVSALHSLTRSANNSNSLLLSLLYIQILV